MPIHRRRDMIVLDRTVSDANAAFLTDQCELSLSDCTNISLDAALQVADLPKHSFQRAELRSMTNSSPRRATSLTPNPISSR